MMMLEKNNLEIAAYMEEWLAHEVVKASGPHLRSLCLAAASVLSVAWLTSVPASAHHEAMFGPQSSAVLSPGVFLSAQVFTRQNGEHDGDRNHETTAVFSAGFQPARKPLSFTLVLPITVVGGAGMPSRRGFEDTVLSARYRLNANGVTSTLGLDESYAMVVGGVEVPTGTFDHAFGHGPVGEIAAGLFSMERRPLSIIGYAYYHHTGEYQGVRESGNLFAGVGTAWTPIDNDVTGKILSVQVGLSHERTFAVEVDGIPLADSGGSGVFVHPGLVMATTPHLQFFALVSLPVTQTWAAPADRQRFRFGAGTIVILGH
jgi:hypothetical protein